MIVKLKLRYSVFFINSPKAARMFLKRSYILIPAFLVLLCIVGCKKDYDDGNNNPPTQQPGQAAIDWEKAADSSTKALMERFWNSSSNYFNEKNNNTNFHYWPQ